DIAPEEAVRAYHGVLQQLGVQPHRALEDDMVLQTNVMSYGGNGVAVSLPIATRGQMPGPEKAGAPSQNGALCPCPHTAAAPAQAAANGEPDFRKMTPAQK